MTSHTVGSTIRTPWPSNSHRNPFTRRAVISTIGKNDKGEEVASLILEDPTPFPLNLQQTHEFTKSITRLKNDNKGPFLVAPNFVSNDASTDEEMDDVPLSSLQPLLPFEVCEPNGEHSDTSAAHAKILKECGDSLLRLRDPSTAVKYYEGALSLTSDISLGGTVILNRGGRPVLAEVDCIEKSDESSDGSKPCLSIDVTYVVDGDEDTISNHDVLLGVLEEHSSLNRLQEKILLNLTRCCLQLSEIDVLRDRPSTRSSRYRKSAILGSSLAMVCYQFVDSISSNSKSDRTATVPLVSTTLNKARLLRAKAYIEMGKNKHANIDLQTILKNDSSCIDAKKLLRSLEHASVVKKKIDRKLAKEMCSWINGATNLVSKNKKLECEEESDIKANGGKKAEGMLWIMLLLILLYLVFFPSYFRKENSLT